MEKTQGGKDQIKEIKHERQRQTKRDKERQRETKRKRERKRGKEGKDSSVTDKVERVRIVGSALPPTLQELLDQLGVMDALQNDHLKTHLLHVSAIEEAFHRGGQQVVALRLDRHSLYEEMALSLPPLELDMALVLISFKGDVLEGRHGVRFIKVFANVVHEHKGEEVKDGHSWKMRVNRVCLTFYLL